MPLNKTYGHAIPLIEDLGSMKIRTYHYLHSQKEQIELIVQQMLEEGIIQISISSSSSPILLVIKEDHTWHLVVDYKALNAII